MKWSFIVPAYNEEKYIVACLASIREALAREGGGEEGEIIVVNNGSTDETKNIALALPGVRVIEESQKGTGFARQRGLREATGEYLAFLDADTRLPVGWLAEAKRIFLEKPGAVCASGPYHYYDATLWEKNFLLFLWWLSVPLTYRITGYVGNLGNFIVKKEALQRIGGFDITITFYGDDTDIARRLYRVGQVIFRMDFFVFSSYRRYKKLGLWRTLCVYAVNFMWEVLFHRPFRL